MLKKSFLFLSFLIGFQVQADQPIFGYNGQLLIAQYKNVKTTIRNHKFKKLAFYGGTAALFVAVFTLKLMKHSSDTNILSYEEMHDCVEKIRADKGEIGWGRWLWNGTKWLTGESAIRGASGFFIGKYMNSMTRRLSLPTIGWYVENHTGNLLNLLKEIEEDADLLPLEENYQERLYKIKILRDKLGIMVPRITSVIAYMIYAKREAEKESVVEAARLDFIIKHLKNSFYVFCKKIEEVLKSCEQEKDSQKALLLAVNIPTMYSTFTGNFYSDIKSFERYEVLGIEG